MTHEAKRRAVSRRWTARRPTCRVATAAALVGMSLGAGACAATGDAGRIAVVGERVGVLVWHPVARAEAYEVEILEGEDRVVHHATTADTVAPLPPSFMPTKESQFVVRALRGGRVIADSERHRIY